MRDFISRWQGRRVLAALVVLTFAGAAMACQVPVFRYALERWTPDGYQLLVISDHSLDAQQDDLIKRLSDGKSMPAGTTVGVHDVSTTESGLVKQIWAKHGMQKQPLLAALYPDQSELSNGPIASVLPLTDDSFERIANSPVRRELVERLSRGDSAVWILLECGEPEKDRRALKTLEKQLGVEAERLKQPSPEELEIEPETLAKAKIKLLIQFSVITVSANDPEERFLVDCLLNSESDLREFREPLAFPVFGRGRVLYALVGAGISAETIQRASSFIVGPCSCQVKEQNPGFDLLLNCDWPAAVGDTFISEPIPEDSAEPRLLTIPPGRLRRPSNR